MVLGVVVLTYMGVSNFIVARRQQTATGVVTAHEPANHDRYGFMFTLAGRKYFGWGSTDSKKLEIGQTVCVYYDPQDPSNNSLKAFGILGLEYSGPLPPLLLAIVAAIGVIKSLRNRRVKPSPD